MHSAMESHWLLIVWVDHRPRFLANPLMSRSYSPIVFPLSGAPAKEAFRTGWNPQIFLSQSTSEAERVQEQPEVARLFQFSNDQSSNVVNELLACEPRRLYLLVYNEPIHTSC